MVMSAAVDLRLTNADIEAMPEDGNRYEVIDGELFVSSAPQAIHQHILMNIGYEFRIYLKQHPIGKVFPGVGIVFDEYDGVIPDLVFATDERMRTALVGGRFRAAPEIVIEIVSPGHSNDRRDRHVKRSLYATHSVEEYWIVDPENRSVEIHRRDSGFENLRGKDELTSPVLPGFSVPVSAFFE
jgi:Uma2 family endonuclease